MSMELTGESTAMRLVRGSGKILLALAVFFLAVVMLMDLSGWKAPQGAPFLSTEWMLGPLYFTMILASIWAMLMLFVILIEWWRTWNR